MKDQISELLIARLKVLNQSIGLRNKKLDTAMTWLFLLN